MKRKRITTHSKSAVSKKKKEINRALHKSGIKTLEQILHTHVLSDAAKVKHIRHKYTCYDENLKIFHDTNEGKEFRKELNAFLEDFVIGKYTIPEFKKFRQELLKKVEQVKEKYKQQQIKLLAEISPEKKIITTNEVSLPDVRDFTEKEIEILETRSAKWIKPEMTDAEKIAVCIRTLCQMRTQWKDAYKRHRYSLDKYIVELYLSKRDSNFYPADFSDLDYIKWKSLVTLAKDWLLAAFDNDRETYEDFVNINLAAWFDKNKFTHIDTVEEKLL